MVDDTRRLQAAFETYSLSGDDSLFLFILRSDLPLTASDRQLLADLWEGKVKLPRGKPRFAVNHDRGKLVQASKLGTAAKRVDLLKKEMGEKARMHGESGKIIAKIAFEEKVNEDQLAARMKLPLRSRYS